MFTKMISTARMNAARPYHTTETFQEKSAEFPAFRTALALGSALTPRDGEKYASRMEGAMLQPRTIGLVVALLGPLVFGCEHKPSIDWSAKENFFLVEKTDKTPEDGVRLEIHSIVDAPADGIYAALADPEDYVAFVQGVTDSGKISAEGNTRVIHITQNVIGRQSRAKVKYTFHPESRKIEFETLDSDLTFNDGSYEITPSPDGKRTYVVSVFRVREKSGQKVPPGVLLSSTRDAFGAAARSVKMRALGQNAKAPT